MLKRLLIAAAIFGLAPLSMAASAWAHGPSRQKVVETIEINAPADKVWAAIGNFQDASWIPVVAKTEGKGGNEKGATRTLTLQNGGTVEEQLDTYDAEGKSYSYEITKVDVKVLPVNDYSSRITVSSEGDKTTVEWKGAFYRGYMLNDPPPELSDEVAFKAVKDLYTSTLEALKKKIEGGS
ncbi:SRPBCC family protein [Hyphomicrobium sp.]|uniref:SRPBCC family protein n=1 Tax=Hyphomicrobium sp. TaxID=82 RepID=UPI002D7782A9|nr:SRPBCC family protein [Hyphomicrobium sp.]HET6388000.1 SRPBCC family protein [Hyphomicrobium sp.]